MKGGFFSQHWPFKKSEAIAHTVSVGTPAHSHMRADRRMDIRARFDSQFTTPLNEAHFALMDAMSVDAMASWMVRRKLRMMCRYEFHNNTLMAGIVNTYANYVVGTGPRLQVTTRDKGLNRAIEKLHDDWSEEVALESLNCSRTFS